MALIFASVFFAFFSVVAAILLFFAEMFLQIELFTKQNIFGGAILFMVVFVIFGKRR